MKQKVLLTAALFTVTTIFTVAISVFASEQSPNDIRDCQIGWNQCVTGCNIASHGIQNFAWRNCISVCNYNYQVCTRNGY